MNDRFTDRLNAMLDLVSSREAGIDALPINGTCPAHCCPTVLDRSKSLLRTSPVYLCPQCEEEARMRRRLAAARDAGIPADVLSATFEGYLTDRKNTKFGSPGEFLSKARQLHDGAVRNLVLCGTAGIGKGHLAAAVANARIARGKSVRWTTCSQLFRRWHRGYEHNTHDAIAAQHGICSLLVLDECGFRELPKDGEECLFEILDLRHKRGLQTILLGNTTLQDLRQWLGERIKDRLNTGGVAFAFGQWDSYRPEQTDAETML
jgi:DNA replication protein DnaC